MKNPFANYELKLQEAEGQLQMIQGAVDKTRHQFYEIFGPPSSSLLLNKLIKVRSSFGNPPPSIDVVLSHA